MTPKEKAFEIYENIYRRTPLVLIEVHRHVSARTISMYMVNEILKANVVWHKDSIPFKYWEKVKKEIKKL